MKVPAVARRAGWNLADQMIVSLSNAVLSFMVANAVSAESFGGFSVAFTVFALVIGASRAVATSPLTIRFSDVEPAEQARAATDTTGLALMIGFVAGTACVIVGLFLPSSVGEALVAMGVVMPAVVTQDALRYVFFSRQLPSGAAFNDAIWTVLQLGAVGVLLYTGSGAVWPLIIAWGASAAVAAVLGARRAATVPDPRRALPWLKEHRNLTGYLFASYAAAHGANQGAMLVIAAVGSALANGALRGAAILLGPTSILSSAAMTFAIPEFSRKRKTFTNREWLVAAAGVSGAVAFLALCWGTIFLLMPDAVGEFVLADTWDNTRELLLAAVVAQVFACATIGPVVMLYAIDRAEATLVIQLVLGSLTFVCGVGGVVIGGGPGAQWGFAVANALVVPFWFGRLWRELRKRGEVGAVDAKQDDEPGPDSSTQFMDEFGDPSMATMVLPRIAPRHPRPSPVPRTGPGAPVGRMPAGGAEQAAVDAGEARPARPMPPRVPPGPRPPLPPGLHGAGGRPPFTGQGRPGPPPQGPPPQERGRVDRPPGSPNGPAGRPPTPFGQRPAGSYPPGLHQPGPHLAGPYPGRPSTAGLPRAAPPQSGPRPAGPRPGGSPSGTPNGAPRPTPARRPSGSDGNGAEKTAEVRARPSAPATPSTEADGRNPGQAVEPGANEQTAQVRPVTRSGGERD